MQKISLGGQAVMEGVMIKSNNYIVTSVRDTKGKIIDKTTKLKQKKKWLKLPLIRGVVNLIEMLIYGMKELTWSANIAEDKEEEKLSYWEIILTLIITFAFSVIIFFAVPIYLTKFIASKAGPMFALVEGLIRISFFLLYVYAISFMKDVKILFQYHGAEHKSVHCYEHKKELTVENVKKFSTIHTRCGSAFVGIVLLLSIAIFSFIKYDTILARLGFKVLLLPLVASLSYEILKNGERFKNNILYKIFITPGIYFQKITTSEPTDKQIEVAIHSMKKILNIEENLSKK